VEVLVRYSAMKLLRGFLICAIGIAILYATPWLFYGTLDRFLRYSVMSYAWIVGLVWGISGIVVLSAIYGYRILKHRGSGIVLRDSRLTVIGIRERTFATADVTAVKRIAGRASAIIIAVGDGDESRVDVSLMAGSAETIESTVNRALLTGGADGGRTL